MMPGARHGELGYDGAEIPLQRLSLGAFHDDRRRVGCILWGRTLHWRRSYLSLSTTCKQMSWVDKCDLAKESPVVDYYL